MSQQINLYEARLRPNGEWLSGRRLGFVLALALAVVALLAVVTRQQAGQASAELAHAQGELAATQQKLAALGKTLAERKVSGALKDEIDGARAQLASRQAVMTLLDSGQLGSTTGFVDVLAGFSRLASNDLWLTAFSISLGGREIELRGRLLEPSKLPAYVARLGSEPAFAGRRFAALDVRRGEAAPAKSEAGSAPAASDAALSPYMDFVLRSENAAGSASSPGGQK